MTPTAKQRRLRVKKIESCKSPEIEKRADLAQRHATGHGEYHTPVPKLTIYRSSSPTDYDAVVHLPSLCVITQVAKEVVIDGVVYRYDPAQSLLVSIDITAATRTVEAASNRPLSGFASNSNRLMWKSCWRKMQWSQHGRQQTVGSLSSRSKMRCWNPRTILNRCLRSFCEKFRWEVRQDRPLLPANGISASTLFLASLTANTPFTTRADCCGWSKPSATPRTGHQLLTTKCLRPQEPRK